MSTLEVRLRDLITALGTQFKTVYALTGDKANLITSTKANLVAAINEVKTAQASAVGINDTTASTSSTYSSSKIDGQISAAVAALVNGAPTALDTLHELADAIGADQSGIAAILTALDKRVRVDAAQSFTTGEQAQARANIGAQDAAAIGNTDRDFVADLNAALV